MIKLTVCQSYVKGLIVLLALRFLSIVRHRILSQRSHVNQDRNSILLPTQLGNQVLIDLPKKLISQYQKTCSGILGISLWFGDVYHLIAV